jgi:aspartokinase/homoserine dehydrogenase 1
VDLDALADHVHAEHLPHAVIVDCSASDKIAEHYAGWLARGIHVITPNKRAGSGPRARFDAIRAARGQRRTRFRYEATVGAGLPIDADAARPLDTGDEAIAIEGMLLGTLAYLLQQLRRQQVVLDARRRARRRSATPSPIRATTSAGSTSRASS